MYLCLKSQNRFQINLSVSTKQGETQLVGAEDLIQRINLFGAEQAIVVFASVITFIAA